MELKMYNAVNKEKITKITFSKTLFCNVTIN